MCGIFGAIGKDSDVIKNLKVLAEHARLRGIDSSGLIVETPNHYQVCRADYDIRKLFAKTKLSDSSVVMGHSRLITNGFSDNQPVVRGTIAVIHNGIIVNDEELWREIKLDRHLEIDSEIIAALSELHRSNFGTLEGISATLLERCKGVISTAILDIEQGKVVLFSNNGSLFMGSKGDTIYYSSEEFPLKEIGCEKIENIINREVILDIPRKASIELHDVGRQRIDLVPKFKSCELERSLLITPTPDLKRCTKCILPETMPFIEFDMQGVCNYCNNYSIRNKPKPKEDIFKLVEPYRRKEGLDCIVPFSGGRDSSYGLHLIVEELKMKPVTFTYDWGMTTDLARRNISRMCQALGVENIIVAADINKKRQNIARNLKAWLKSPHLGMTNILTAGDKHFFRHVESIKRRTGINLNLWGVNPLEVTHFKAGFLGVPPAFDEKRVYMHGWRKQLRYQKLRLSAMCQSPGYFNSSLWDTLSGEYYRSFTEKKDYFHIFDYWRWDEKVIDDTLINNYGWETAVDTSTTWRIGDGTAAFYNYIYYLIAGFTEHDTFRSNQIREGEITREEALTLVEEENQPRYENIRWYLDTLGMDYSDTIKQLNKVPRLYQEREAF